MGFAARHHKRGRLITSRRLRATGLLSRRDCASAFAVDHRVVVLALLHGAVYGAAFWLLGVLGAALWRMVGSDTVTGHE
jgi:hypothetical protein